MTSQKSQRRLALAAAVCASTSIHGASLRADARRRPPSFGQARQGGEERQTGIAKLTLTENGLARMDLKTETVKPPERDGRAAALCVTAV